MGAGPGAGAGLGAVVLDEVDGRTLAIDGDGVGQVEIVADDGVFEDCRNVFYVGVLGVDFGSVDREVAFAASGVFPVECDMGIAADGQVADRPQGGIGGGGRLDGGAANRQIAAGEQAGIDALCHNAGVRNANVAARCAAAGADECGVAAIFRRGDIDHAAVFDNKVDGVDARIQRGGRDLRVVERDRAVACDADAARGVNGEDRFVYRDVAGNAYAVLGFSRDVNLEAAWARNLDISCGHDAHVVVKGDVVAALKRDGQITRQPRIDAARNECIRDGRIVQRKGMRSGVVRCRTLAAFDGEIVAGESLAVDVQVVVRRVGECRCRQHHHGEGKRCGKAH